MRISDWSSDVCSSDLNLRIDARYFAISFIAIAVRASVAVDTTAGASGAPTGEWRLGSVRPSVFAADISAAGTPPTQTLRLLMLLSLRASRPKSTPPITGGIWKTRWPPHPDRSSAAIAPRIAVVGHI